MTKQSSKVVVVTVSTEQFDNAIEGVVLAGNSALEALTVIASYIAQATNFTDQSKAKKQLAQAWVKYQLAVEGKKIKLESAQVWVGRRVKALAPAGFKWLTSTSTKAKAMAKSRKARQTKGDVTPAPAPAKAPAEKLTSIELYRNAIIAKQNEIMDNFRNQIPAGKRQDFEQAFASFIDTLNVILK